MMITSLALPPDLRERIERAAIEREQTFSAFMRLAARRELERIEREAAKPTVIEDE